MQDKNSTIGIILMIGLVLIWMMFFQPDVEESTPEQQTTSQQDQIEPQREIPKTPTEQIAEEAEKDSVQTAQMQSQYGPFAGAMKGTEKRLKVSTDKLNLEFSNFGARLVNASLTEHQTYDSLPLPLITDELNNAFFMQFAAVVNQSVMPIRTDKIYFAPSQDGDITVSGTDSTALVFRADLGGEKAILLTYFIKGSAYDVAYELEFVGMDRMMKNRFFELNWESEIPRTEKNLNAQRTKSQIVYKQGNNVETLGGMSDDTKTEFIQNGVDWVTYKSQFFSYSLIPQRPFSSANLEISTPETSELIDKKMIAKIQVPLERGGKSSRVKIFLGPLEYKTLTSYDALLEDQMDLGYSFISWINKGTIWVFKFLEKHVSNYGIIILIFAFFVKTIVFPFTYKSYVSMAKLRVVNDTPEIKELDEKYKDDAQKLQLKKMEIYKKMKVNPLGGCLPMVFQYPILISMFFFFPQAIELRHKSFLWAHDLSTYDAFWNLPFSIPGIGDHISLFTLLMAVSIYIYTFIQQKSQPTNAAMPFMKYLPYFMPLIFMVFLNNYASGLSWYYFVVQIVSIIQTTAIKASLNEEKLLAEMRAASSKSKGKKKSGGNRLQKWAASQQKKQADMREEQGGGATNEKKGTNRIGKKKKRK